MTSDTIDGLRPVRVYQEPEGHTWWCRVCAADGEFFVDVTSAHEDAQAHARSCPVLYSRSPNRPKVNLRRRPTRVQRHRTRGWRMPKGTVFVGRNTRWGNPWPIGATMPTVLPGGEIDLEPRLITRDLAIESYRNRTEWLMSFDAFAAELRHELAYRDLACWCRVEDPCHADVLLSLAAT